MFFHSLISHWMIQNSVTMKLFHMSQCMTFLVIFPICLMKCHIIWKNHLPQSLLNLNRRYYKSQKQTHKSKKCKSKSPKLNAQTCYRNVVPANDMRESDKNLPSKLNVAKELQESIKLTSEGKEVKRCVDYRASLLKVTHLMKGKLPDDFQVILDTLTEIQEILYSYDEQRSSRIVLRLYNLTFWHAVMLKIVLGTQMKSLTTRKFYGKYFHGLISHSPLQHRPHVRCINEH